MLLLLTLIGGEAYGVLKDLLAPELPSTKNFVQLLQSLLDHYSPKMLVIAERYKFYNTIQESNEDIKSFVARLKNVAQYCNFGQFLSECLRDRLVCGVGSFPIKRKLLSEDNLTFEKAYAIAVSMELTEGQVKSMGAEGTNSNLSVVREGLDKLSIKKNVKKSSDKGQYASQNSSKDRSRGPKREFKPCYRCNRKHDATTCPAKEWECFKCKKTGHTSRVCRGQKVDAVQEESQSEEDENSLVLSFLSVLESGKANPESVKVEVEGKLINFEIDCGACRTVMHINDFNKYLSELNLYSVKYNLRVLTGEGVQILGETDVIVTHNNKMIHLPLVILKSSHKFVPLLGRNWLDVLNPEWRNKINFKNTKNINVVTKSGESSQLQVESQSLGNISLVGQSNKVEPKMGLVESQEISKLVSKIKNNFKEVFDEQPGSYIKHFEVELKLKEGANPFFIELMICLLH